MKILGFPSRDGQKVRKAPTAGIVSPALPSRLDRQESQTLIKDRDQNE